MAKSRLGIPQIESPTPVGKEMLRIAHRELRYRVAWNWNPLSFLFDALSRRRIKQELPSAVIRRSDEYTWVATAPDELGTFFGRTVEMELGVSYFAPDWFRWIGWRQAVSRDDLALVLFIKKHLPSILPNLEQHLMAKADADEPDDWAETIGRAYVSLDNDPDRPANQWSFVMEKREDESLGWHFTFEHDEMTDDWDRGI